MNHEKMIKEIWEVVEMSMYTELEHRTLPNSKPFTQKEAISLINSLGKIYGIAHSLDCIACGSKYRK